MLSQIAGLILNQPLLVTPEHAETVLSILDGRIGVDASELSRGSGGARHGSGEAKMVGNGTLLLPVVGTLTHRATGMQAASGVMDYGGLEAKIEAAMQNPEVKSILLDISSPGGAVAGAFDLRDYIMAQRGRKPMASIARDTMASAAYLIGSATDRIISTQTGMVGSIGVVMAHIDRSKQLEQQGVKPTFIHAGAMKVAGNSAEPLSDEVRSELQESIDESYEKFVTAVVEARGMSAEAVKATEARMFVGSTAVEKGLADEVGTLGSAIESFAADAPRSYPSMSIQGNADMNEDELRAEGATAERARISAILNHDSAKDRTTLASHFAFNTQMSVEDAAAALGASPAEAAAPVDDSAALAAANAKIAELQAAAGTAQNKTLASIADDASGVGEGGEGASTETMTAEQTRISEAVAAVRAAQGRA